MSLSLHFWRIVVRLIYIFVICMSGALWFVSSLAAQTAPEARILVYTRNYTPDGKGYVHDNIASSVAAIRKMGQESGFIVDASDDPGVFTDANLRQYAALVFSNSNNQAFSDDAQRDAFKHYIEAGGGFVGLHSASGSERDWPYFWSVLGGKFVAHPHQQPFTVRVVDPDFAAAKGLPAQFTWTDECYFLDHLNPGIHPVLVTDRTKLSTEPMTIDVTKFPSICRWRGTRNSTVGASFTWRSATIRKTTRIRCSTASSGTAFCGR